VDDDASTWFINPVPEFSLSRVVNS